MTKPSIILVGAGSHSHACIDVIEQHEQYKIAGLIGTEGELHQESLGYRVIATDAELPDLAARYDSALVSVGQISSPDTRIRLYEQTKKFGFLLPAIVSPKAYVSRHARIGAGTIVMHGAIVNAGAIVGENCIINSRALLEHDVVVEEHCHISTGAILNGRVSIGAGSFVGSSSVVKDGIRLGRNCLVGMGLSVRNHQMDNAKFTGHGKT